MLIKLNLHKQLSKFILYKKQRMKQQKLWQKAGGKKLLDSLKVKARLLAGQSPKRKSETPGKSTLGNRKKSQTLT